MPIERFVKMEAAFTMVVLLLAQTTTRVEACSCLPAGLYEGFHDADVVIHGTALDRSEQADTYEDVTYTLATVTVYKEDPDVTLTQEVGFETFGNSFICGVELELGEDYLLGLYRTEGYSNLTATSCGLVWNWSWLTDKDKASVESGCEDDPCDDACAKSQECLYYPVGSPGVYYCADVCKPTTCGYKEACALEYIECSDEPCPPIANCSVYYETNHNN